MDTWFWELKVFADFEVPIVNILTRHHIITLLNVKGVACSEDPTQNSSFKSSNSLVPLSFMEQHSDFQLIHFDFPAHHLRAQREALFSSKSIV